MIIKEKIEIAEKNLERLLSQIKSVDNKCVLLLSLNIAMLGILVNFAPCANQWNIFMIITTIITLLMLLTSLTFTLLGSYPQIKGPKRSLISFSPIAENYDKFKNDFLNLNEQDYIEDILKQCHRNAEILNNKYHRLKKAFILFFIGLILWIVNIYLFKSI